MKTILTSATVLAGLLIGISTASACDWHKQVMASAAPGPTEQQRSPEATSVDPTLLAWLDKKPVETKEATPVDQPAK